MTNELNLTDAEIEAQWDAANNNGEGFSAGSVGMSPREAAEAEGYTDIRTFDTYGSLSTNVVARSGEQWIAICDANGPWAQYVTNDDAA